MVNRSTKSIEKFSGIFWLLLLLFNIDFVVAHLISILNLPEVMSNIVHWILYFYILTKWFILSDLNSKLKTLLFIMIILSIISIDYFMNPYLLEYISPNLINIFIVCIPYFALATNIYDFDALMSKAFKVNIFSSAMVLLMAYFSLSGISNNLGYDYMSVSYNMLIGIILNLYCALRKKNIVLWCVFIIQMLVLIIVGARGPIFCVLLFILLYFLKHHKLYSVTAIKVYFFTVLSATVIVFNLRVITLFIIDILDRFNLTSRSITYLLSGSFTQTTTRDYIRENLLEYIKLNPLRGYGLFSDRMLNENIMHSQLQGSYAHNIFLELIINFGIPVGLLIIIILLISIIKQIKNSSYNKSVFLMMLVSISIGKLLFTSSYLIEQYFYVLLGIIINYNSRMIKKDGGK